MNNDEALVLIKKAIEAVEPGAGENVSVETHLVEDKVLDSLAVMNFLFELENLMGGDIEEIDEEFTDFRVEKIIEILRAS